MSEIKKITVEETEFTFYNKFVRNRSGFKHETELFQGTRLLSTAKCQYYNRTWESYTYQSSMQQAVSNAIAGREEELVADYKEEHGIYKMSVGKKATLYAKDSTIELLQKLYKLL